MQIEGGLQTVIVDEVDECLWRGDERFIPAPACPATLVPIHIHDEHIHRNIVLFHIANNLHELALCISPIAAVPVAQNVFRGHRHTASHLDVVAQTRLIIMSVAQEVPVDSRLVDRVRPPCDALFFGFKSVRSATVAAKGRGALVDDAPTGPGQEALLQVSPFVVAPGAIQGAVRAEQVHRVVLARIPDDITAIQLERDHQIVGLLVGCLEDTALFVAERDVCCADVEVAVGCLGGELRNRQAAVDDGKRSAVLELCSCAVLDAYHPAREYRETGFPRNNDRSRISYRVKHVLCTSWQNQ